VPGGRAGRRGARTTGGRRRSGTRRRTGTARRRTRGGRSRPDGGSRRRRRSHRGCRCGRGGRCRGCRGSGRRRSGRGHRRRGRRGRCGGRRSGRRRSGRCRGCRGGRRSGRCRSGRARARGSPGARLGGRTGRGGRAALIAQLLTQPTDDGRFNGRRRRPDELTELLELGHHDLALDSELFRELVDPDLGHISPVSVRPDRTDRRYDLGALIAARSSLCAHRALIGCCSSLSTRFLRCDGADRFPCPGNRPGVEETP
jgi:hypothetical protein